VTVAYTFRWEIALESAGALAHGLKVTLQLSALSFVLSLALGLVVALCRLAPSRAVRAVAYAYTQIFRALSLYVYVLFLYFGIAAVFGINLGTFAAGVAALTLLNSAYMAEIYRAAIGSVDPGQREAALALGLTRTRSFASVTLPQAGRVAVPGLVNQLVDIVKDSSIVAVIGVFDLMGTTIQIVNSERAPFELYTVTALTYVALILLISAAAALLERRLARHLTGGGPGPGPLARMRDFRLRGEAPA
jgi:His/Glu/Gln/Arg/opine family amino acid ABC transporter permease subunit